MPKSDPLDALLSSVEYLLLQLDRNPDRDIIIAQCNTIRTRLALYREHQRTMSFKE